MTIAPSTPSMFGTYKGIVTNDNDPEGMGRIKAICPTVFGDMTTETEWAWPCVMPGAVFATPQPEEGVWLQFESGDTGYPLWIGTWNTSGKGQFIPTVPGPATAVIGPDGFGAPSAVGNSKLYARGDHDHGLPAVFLKCHAGHIPTVVTLPVNTPTEVIDTASLDIGMWLVTMGMLGGVADTSSGISFQAQIKSGTATLEGQLSTALGYAPTYVGGALSGSIIFIATVTVAAVLKMTAVCSGASGGAAAASGTINNQVLTNCTGYTAMQIA